MPILGADMTAGTLVAWRKRPGDHVQRGDIIAEVETEKGLIEVEIFTTGVIEKILVDPGTQVPVGTPLAIIREEGAAAPQAMPPPIPSAAEGARLRISPAAKKLALELGVDVVGVRGTGTAGAITLDDVKQAAGAVTPAAPVDRFARMRQTIAAAMARSKREIPHYYVAEDIPLAKALAWLQAENAQRPMAERLLPAVLLLKAVAIALKRFPELNGFFRDGAFVPAGGINLGVAISLRQGGLIAPALLNAEAKPLTQLMQELTDLVQRTRAGSLRSSELADASITVTNLGDQGTQAVFGVIYPPQVALVGFGRVAERPWVEDGGIRPVPVVTASLSADHRVSDGHRGALFLRELADLLQRPEELNQ